MAQGLAVSRLPQISQVRVAAAASRIAAASGSSSRSRFFSSTSAARRAERGPRPGSLASNWIRRSISEPEAISLSVDSGTAGATSCASTSRTATISAPGNGPARRAPSAPASRFRCAPPWRSSSARPGWARRLRWRSKRVQRTPVQSRSFCCRSPARVRGARGLGRNSSRPGFQLHQMHVVFDMHFQHRAHVLLRPARRCLPGRAATGAPSRHGLCALARAARRPMRAGPRPPRRGRAAGRRRRRAAQARRRPAYRAPACRWAAGRRHRPGGSAPSRRPRSGAWRRALRTGP